MSRAHEITLKGDFLDFIEIFINTFPRSLQRANIAEEDLDVSLQAYEDVITSNLAEIIRGAAFSISGYLNLYNVHANQSADEFKLIYFLGKSIESHLINNGYVDVAKAHMMSVIGLLDFRLITLKIVKPTLTKAMVRLIRTRQLYDRLGPDGCYLTYKCVSTTPSNVVPVQDL